MDICLLEWTGLLLVQFCHPDKLVNASSEQKKAGEERFKRLTKAYHYLKKVKGAN